MHYRFHEFLRAWYAADDLIWRSCAAPLTHFRSRKMYFATFYQPSAIDKTKLIEGCGDRAVIILDGRWVDHHQTAARVCRERGYLAYQLHKGQTLCRGVTSTSICRLFGN